LNSAANRPSSVKKRRGPRGRGFTRIPQIEALESRQMLTVFTVDTTVDEDNGINVGGRSLREAITVAVSGDTINFDASLMNGATITLDRTKGELAIDGKSLTIDASMLSSIITIDADDPSSTPGDGIRIFDITNPIGGVDTPLVTMVGLRLTGGRFI
jgi:hypothetical protein